MGIALRYLKLVLLFAAFGALSAGTSGAVSDSREEILVGRIAHVEGKLLRYIEEDKDWVITVRDSPFGLEDALYSGVGAKAEFIMPNRTWIRVGENTQIQLIDLYPDATTVDVASGLARLYNNSDDVVIKATTPFGYVVAPGGTIFDLYVGDESIEVIAVRGNVDFVHEGSKFRYQIQEGSSSIIADANDVASGNGAVDSLWDDWNGKRDYVWLQRLQRSEYSARFLPEPIRDEAYALEENGRWERVYYEGEYVHMWRPIRVNREWRPFTAGRWTVYYGDNCWIPDEPFGYVTHHYGSWVYLQSARAWYWMPPVARFTLDTPEYFIGFGWYPGRVGWIHSGPSIGWVPLAPYEAYYGYRPWGHRTIVISHTTIINITEIRYRFLDEAIIIDRDYFYRGSRYTPHVRRNIDRDIIINTYRPITVINNTVINNFNTDKRRFAYNDERVSRKPHATVINRISDNQESSRKSGRINRDRIERDLTRFDARSEPLREREVRRPMLTTKLVDASQVSRPINTLSLQKKEIKPKARERQISTDNEQRGRRVERLERARESVNQEEQRRIRSPREPRSEGPEQVIRRPDQDPKAEDNQRGREPQIRRQQLEEGQGRQDQGPQRRPESDVRESQEQRRQAAEKVKEEIQAERQQGERQSVRKPEKVDAEPRIRSPRETGVQDTEKSSGRQDQIRRQDENQGQNEQQIRRQEQEVRRQQQEETRRQQAQEPQQGQQQVENQRRQEQEVRRQQQEEARRQQVQETQQRQQVENQRRQEQEVRRPQQVEDRRQQVQETQRQQQVENQRRQEQEVRRQQQEEARRQQAQEAQQQQVENQRRQEQEVRRQQQEEARRQQVQETQQRQQVENQRRQEQEVRRRQQEEVQRSQVQQQSEKKKNRNQQEQEEWEEEQQKERGQGKQRSRQN